MFESDPFKKREQALEDEFFRRVDAKLRDRLRQSIEREGSRDALSAATGLNDSDLLDELIDAGLGPTTIAALSLVPSVFVAWADGNVSEPECDAVHSAAVSCGIEADSVAMQLIDSWLGTKPEPSLWEAWKHCAKATSGTLSKPAGGLLAGEVVRLAKAVAEASGGVMGFGKICQAEQALLNEIELRLGQS